MLLRIMLAHKAEGMLAVTDVLLDVLSPRDPEKHPRAGGGRHHNDDEPTIGIITFLGLMIVRRRGDQI
jgi:hypothetical protein